MNPEMIARMGDKLNIVYTPLHGSGNLPVRRNLAKSGFKKVFIVKEQELPDSSFSTVDYPNPEDTKVFTLARKLAAEVNADVLIGTDPDCDRMGAMVKDSEGNFVALTGNMVGALATDYILSQRKEQGRLPANGVVVKTIVSTEMIITRYENAFAAIPLLVSFIPMLMDTGGNCGSQSATLIIRGIALDEIRFTDLFKVMFKEFRISLIVGAFLAVANGVRIFIQYHNPGLAVVIACSLMGTVIMAKLVGCILPLLAKKVNLDPAIMASPLITTLVDTFSILIYFNIATVLFRL